MVTDSQVVEHRVSGIQVLECLDYEITPAQPVTQVVLLRLLHSDDTSQTCVLTATDALALAGRIIQVMRDREHAWQTKID